MVELFDAEPSLLTYFKSQPVKKEIIRRLAQNVSSLFSHQPVQGRLKLMTLTMFQYDKIAGNVDDLLTVLQFGLKIDEKVNRVESLISLNMNKLNGDQVSRILGGFD